MPQRMVFTVLATTSPFYFLCMSITLYHLLPTSATAIPAAVWTHHYLLDVAAEVATTPPPLQGP